MHPLPPGVEGFMYPNEIELQWSVLIVLYPFITGLVAGAFILASLQRVFKVEAVKPTYKLALLTALASTGRTLFSSGAGFAAAFLGWTWFFIGTSLTAVPALLMMVWLQRRGHFRTLEAQRNGG